MSNCFVCGRKLKNPCTAARGCGPVCCGPCGSAVTGKKSKVKKFRSFYERVSMRWARPWGLDWERWLEEERPCLVCRSAVLLKVELADGVPLLLTRKSTAHEARFVELLKVGSQIAAPGYWESDAVPAWCRKLKVFIDANRSSRHVRNLPPIDAVQCKYFASRSHSRPAQMSLAEVVNA